MTDMRYFCPTCHTDHSPSGSCPLTAEWPEYADPQTDDEMHARTDAEVRKGSEVVGAIYGYCPKCGARGVKCEQIPDGNTTCFNGHSYPSRDATLTSLVHGDMDAPLGEPGPFPEEPKSGHDAFNEMMAGFADEAKKIRFREFHAEFLRIEALHAASRIVAGASFGSKITIDNGKEGTDAFTIDLARRFMPFLEDG